MLGGYEEMARRELGRKAALYEADHDLDRHDVDAWFPSRTVWVMRQSGNGVAQVAAESLVPGQFTGGRARPSGSRDAFSQCRYDLWQACESACDEGLVGVLEVEGGAHAVFGGELQGLPDADLLELSSYVVSRHEVEQKIEALTAKIERAKAEGADSDYPEVAGAVAEVGALREQSERIDEAYQDRLTLAKNDEEMARLTEDEKRKADRRERALKDLTEPFDDD